MQTTKALNTVLTMVAEDRTEPFRMMWPTTGNPAGWVTFATFPEWRAFALALNLTRMVPDTVAARFDRALKVYLLAWLDFELIKIGELIALTALELALRDRYGDKVKDRRGNIHFSHLLAY